jgi:hypothetical protein
MITPPPSFAELMKALLSDWGGRVSGAFSIPFTVAALYVNDAYGKALWSVLAMASLIYGVYSVWSSERRRVVELEKRLDQQKPEFIATFGNVVIGFVPDPENIVGAHIQLAITNRGVSSVITGWSAGVSIDDEVFGADVEHTTDPVTLEFHNGSQVIIPPEDLIYDRVGSAPIETGHRQTGWVRLMVKTLPREPREDLLRASWIIKVSDYLGRVHTFESGPGYSGGSLRHLPGSNHPIVRGPIQP